jgi:chromosome partitioning protein
MKVLNCYSLKGGVGKTSTAVNLGAVAAADGWRVLLIDLDPQGASSFLLHHDHLEGAGLGEELQKKKPNLLRPLRATNVDRLYILPFNDRTRFFSSDLKEIDSLEIRVSKALSSIDDDFDLVVIDSPPTADDVLKFQLLATDLTLMVTTVSPLALRATIEYLTHVRDQYRSNAPHRTTLQMVETTSKRHLELIEDLRKITALNLTRSVIRRSSLIENMALERIPTVTAHPRSTVAQNFLSLWRELDLLS